jgi:hypothetical protein
MPRIRQNNNRPAAFLLGQLDEVFCQCKLRPSDVFSPATAWMSERTLTRGALPPLDWFDQLAHRCAVPNPSVNPGTRVLPAPTAMRKFPGIPMVRKTAAAPRSSARRLRRSGDAPPKLYAPIPAVTGDLGQFLDILKHVIAIDRFVRPFFIGATKPGSGFGRGSAEQAAGRGASGEVFLSRRGPNRYDRRLRHANSSTYDSAPCRPRS